MVSKEKGVMQWNQQLQAIILDAMKKMILCGALEIEAEDLNYVQSMKMAWFKVEWD